jgi:glycosyltransferase involved in cell wall biosynthesis
LVNQYPKISHSFIRREILELEKQGVEVERFALRGWDEDVVDSLDLEERNQTAYTLRKGAPVLFSRALWRLIRHPIPVLRAVRAALAMSSGGIRPWPYHLVYVAHACRIMDWIDLTSVQHLHAHFGTNSAEIAHLVRVMGGPSYSFTVHGMDEADNAKHLHFERKIGNAAFVVAISAYTRSQLMRHVDALLWEKIKVVHCGLPDRAFANRCREQEGPTHPVFLCIGRMNPEKGHLLLLEAFARITRAHPTARLVLAGDGDLRTRIELRITELGLDEAVRITGWIDSARVAEELENCSALVQPSFIEGLPVVIMEAMAQRRVVISTFVAGIPELVVHGENGWLVPAGTVEELTEAMDARIRISAERLRAMQDAGFRRVKARHSIATEVKKLKALIEAA